MDDTASLQADIASRLSISHLPEDQKSEIINLLTELVIDRVQLEIWRRLDDEDKATFESLKTPEEIDTFVRSRIPELKNLIELSALTTIQQFEKTQQV